MTDDIYQPREDSRLIAESAVTVCSPSDTVLDLGTGSGFVGEFIVNEVGCEVVSSDISRSACVSAGDKSLEVVQGDLMRHFSENSFDKLVFNAPYLPSENAVDEFDERALSYDSGGNIIEGFIEDLDRVLSEQGAGLLLISSKTGIEEVTDMASKKDFLSEEILSIEAFYERLVVLKLTTN